MAYITVLRGALPDILQAMVNVKQRFNLLVYLMQQNIPRSSRKIARARDHLQILGPSKH